MFKQSGDEQPKALYHWPGVYCTCVNFGQWERVPNGPKVRPPPTSVPLKAALSFWIMFHFLRTSGTYMGLSTSGVPLNLLDGFCPCCSLCTATSCNHYKSWGAHLGVCREIIQFGSTMKKSLTMQSKPQIMPFPLKTLCFGNQPSKNIICLGKQAVIWGRLWSGICEPFGSCDHPSGEQRSPPRLEETCRWLEKFNLGDVDILFIICTLWSKLSTVVLFEICQEHFVKSHFWLLLEQQVAPQERIPTESWSGSFCRSPKGNVEWDFTPRT